MKSRDFELNGPNLGNIRYKMKDIAMNYLLMCGPRSKSRVYSKKKEKEEPFSVLTEEIVNKRFKKLLTEEEKARIADVRFIQHNNYSVI